MPGTQTAVACPVCGGEMYDNRGTKKNPKQPDFKCKDYKAGCAGVIWPPKPAQNGGRSTSESQTGKAQPVNHGDLPGDLGTDVDFPILCKRYADCVGYVVTKVVPYLDEKGIVGNAEVVSSMAACLFIERNRRNV